MTGMQPFATRRVQITTVPINDGVAQEQKYAAAANFHGYRSFIFSVETLEF
jgi:hypothetical protein